MGGEEKKEREGKGGGEKKEREGKREIFSSFCNSK